MNTVNPGNIRAWVLAGRPKTLPAAVMPVVIGTALALHDSMFRAGPAVAALICALLIQIGTNYANDLMDFKAGKDTPDRTGPTRAAASGWLTESQMMWGTVIVFVLTIPLGLYLIAAAGWPVLVIGLASIAAGVAYTGGPYPLAYHGLGDVFVFLFFGLVATVGTYYVQAEQITGLSLLVALPAGGLVTNILVINNYRDIPTDRQTGKHTLAVMLGESGTRIEFIILALVSYAIPLILLLTHQFSLPILLPWLSAPVAVGIIRQLYTGMRGQALNKTLAQTARLSLIFGLLFSAGLLFS